jgi:hypothetical protein
METCESCGRIFSLDDRYWLDRDGIKHPIEDGREYCDDCLKIMGEEWRAEGN